MKATVDRMEENFIVLITPDGRWANMDKRLCPEAREGDIVSIEIDKDASDKKRADIEEKFNRLKKTTSDK